MCKKLVSVLAGLVLGLGFVCDLSAEYIDAKAFPFATAIQGPPAPDSPAGQAEFAAMLTLQEYRAADDVQRVRADNLLNLHLSFDDVMGDWFVHGRLPLTMKLLRHVVTDIGAVTDLAKKNWNRARPYQQNRDIKPCVGVPGNASYPSGHTTNAFSNALTLADLCPDLKDAILARAERIGRGRVVAGVHFPSDVLDGRALAEAVYREIAATPQFQADLAAAKAEVEQVRNTAR
ncbi:MAG: phosphatase PAP2 family protein [Verrucomicrobiales bacterium]|nr:phosphatase PAP2 family protein [Verrucomicrobiales bacterium]